jgi:hypothetical protein
MSGTDPRDTFDLLLAARSEPTVETLDALFRRLSRIANALCEKFPDDRSLETMRINADAGTGFVEDLRLAIDEQNCTEAAVAMDRVRAIFADYAGDSIDLSDWGPDGVATLCDAAP